MTSRILEDMRAVCDAQVEAMRRGDLDRLEALETERKALIAALGPESLAELAASQPERLVGLLREIEEKERLVRTALQEGLQKRRELLEKVERRRRAEHSYRRTA